MIIKGAFTGIVLAIIGIIIFEGTGSGMGFHAEEELERFEALAALSRSR